RLHVAGDVDLDKDPAIANILEQLGPLDQARAVADSCRVAGVDRLGDALPSCRLASVDSDAQPTATRDRERLAMMLRWPSRLASRAVEAQHSCPAHLLRVIGHSDIMSLCVRHPRSV